MTLSPVSKKEKRKTKSHIFREKKKKSGHVCLHVSPPHPHPHLCSHHHPSFLDSNHNIVIGATYVDDDDDDDDDVDDTQ